jgi:hypothetical protein
METYPRPASEAKVAIVNRAAAGQLGKNEGYDIRSESPEFKDHSTVF